MSQTHMHTQCDCRSLTVLLKSIYKHMFGRMFSTGGKQLKKLHAEDQQCFWLHQLNHTVMYWTHNTCICHTKIHREYIHAWQRSFPILQPHTNTCIQNVDERTTIAITVIISALVTTQNFVSLQPIVFQSFPFQRLLKARQITPMGARSNQDFFQTRKNFYL